MPKESTFSRRYTSVTLHFLLETEVAETDHVLGQNVLRSHFFFVFLNIWYKLRQSTREAET